MALHEEILINNNGYTESAYVTCGDTGCTQAVLRQLGVPAKVIQREGTGIQEFPIGDGCTITVLLLGESDSDEWCSAEGCREFLRHGLSCECPADEYGNQPDREPLSGKHPYLT